MKKVIVVLSLLLIGLGLSAADLFKGTSLNFDGYDDYVQVNQAVIPTSGDFTISVWAKTATLHNLFEIVSQNAVSGNHFYIGNYNGIIRAGDGWGNTGVAFPADGNWHHFTIVKTSSNTHLYVDGHWAASKGSPIANPDGNVFRLGRQYGGNGEYFAGEIDEVRVWNYARNGVQTYADTYRYYTQNEWGLTSYWQFNEGSGTTTTDCVSSITGYLYNMSAGSWVTSAVPRYPAFEYGSANCFAFDGIDDYMQCNNYIIPSSGDFTVSVWAKATSTAGIFELMSQEGGGSTHFYLGGYNGTMRVSDGWLTTVPYPTDGNWHFFTVAKSSTNTSLYIDGVLQEERGWAINNPLSYDCRLGRQFGSFGEYFNGYIDEFRVWNTCLDAAQIQQNMNRCFDNTEPNLRIYWQLNEYYGTIARDYVSSNIGAFYNTANGSWIASTAPLAVPKISTTVASSITRNTASSGGSITDNGGAAVTARGVCWNTSPNPTTANSYTSDGAGTGSYTSLLTGLTAYTTYYYRAYAVNSYGTAYGEEYSFTTLAPVLPTVTTTIASSITSSSTTSGGNVIENGGASVTNRGVCWSTSPNPTIANSYTTDGSGMGSFTSSLTGLDALTTYYYRAYAMNYIGVNYGVEYSFTTLPFPGSGTVGDPYIISNLTELRWLSEDLTYWSSHFIQTADIDASDSQNWNSGAGFSPIGNDTNRFTGNYNGQDYSVNGLFIDREWTDHIGLFGYCYYSTISNVGVKNANITGSDYVGTLIGYNDNSTTTNCFSTGNVYGSSQTAGLIGKNYYSNVSFCYNSADVSAPSSLGGISGYIYASNINNCCNTGDITGNDYIGGILGWQDNSSTSNCFNTGNTSGFSYIGGIMGYNPGTVSNCYSTGVITGTYSFGGLIGYNSSAVNNCFWDIQTSGQSSSAGGTGKTTAEMNDVATYTSLATTGLDSPWDFEGNPYDDTGNDDFWKIDNTQYYGYPYFSWLPLIPTVSTIATSNVTESSATVEGNAINDNGADITSRGICYSISNDPTINDLVVYSGSGLGTFTADLTGLAPLTTYYCRAFAENIAGVSYGVSISFSTHYSVTPPSGSGTVQAPYLISDLFELIWISDNPSSWDSYYIQTTDIDATPTIILQGGVGFEPIGIHPSWATRDPFTGTYDGQGFVIDGLFINRPSSGYTGLFGYSEYANFLNLGLTNVSITGDGYDGALVGFSSDFSSISNCYSTGQINGEGCDGGLVGEAYSTTITKCFSTCSVTGSNRTGGLVGINFSSTISNSYSTGNVSGVSRTGGLAGENYNGSAINNCFSTGYVDGYSDTGGLVGYNSYSTVNNCFWDTDTSSQYSSAGGTGKTTAEMQDVATYTDLSTTGLSSPWDFFYNPNDDTANANYWILDSVNRNSYPSLLWEMGCAADFYASSTNVEAGELVQFVDTSYNATSWQWDFDNDGGIDSTEQNPIYSYPSAGVYSVKLTVSNGDDSHSYTISDYITVYYNPDGSGTIEDPYQIATLVDLLWLSEETSVWSSHFIQTADIDATDTDPMLELSIFFYPVGHSEDPFTGTYNGQRYVISNLHIKHYTWNEVGMFGYTNGATISNLGLSEIDVEGSWDVGSIVGRSVQTTISECYSSGNVSGFTNTGGFVGVNSSNSLIQNNYSLCTVTGSSDNTGGFAGFIETNSTISDCYSWGEVSGDMYVGGFVGSIDQTGGTIANCYSTGNVFGNYGAGGFHGNNDSTITNSFWDLETSIPTNGYGDSSGITGKTTIEMQDVATYTAITTAGLNSSWDFYGNPNDDTGNDDFWGINVVGNQGYPFFMWQGYTAEINPPQNVTIEVMGSDIQINWDDVTGASSYKIFAADTPDGPFVDVTGEGTFSPSRTTQSWTAPVDGSKKFYYVVASTETPRKSNKGLKKN